MLYAHEKYFDVVQKLKLVFRNVINVYRNGVPYINEMGNDGLQYSADEYRIQSLINPFKLWQLMYSHT